MTQTTTCTAAPDFIGSAIAKTPPFSAAKWCDVKGMTKEIKNGPGDIYAAVKSEIGKLADAAEKAGQSDVADKIRATKVSATMPHLIAALPRL